MKKIMPLALALILLILISISCSDDSPKIDSNLLTDSPWKRVRRLEIHVRNNDTLYKANYYTTDTCFLNSYLTLNKDRSATIDRNCDVFFAPGKVSGKWNVDSKNNLTINFKDNYVGIVIFPIENSKITKLTSDSLVIYWSKSGTVTNPDNSKYNATNTVFQYFVH